MSELAVLHLAKPGFEEISKSKKEAIEEVLHSSRMKKNILIRNILGSAFHVVYEHGVSVGEPFRPASAGWHIDSDEPQARFQLATSTTPPMHAHGTLIVHDAFKEFARETSKELITDVPDFYVLDKLNRYFGTDWLEVALNSEPSFDKTLLDCLITLEDFSLVQQPDYTVAHMYGRDSLHKSMSLQAGDPTERFIGITGTVPNLFIAV